MFTARCELSSISDSDYCPNLREGQTGEAWDPIRKFGSLGWENTFVGV